MVLYKISNTITGQFYVGQSRLGIKGRIRCHKSKGRMADWFKSDIAKVEVIAKASDIGELDSLESLYIDTYKEIFPDLLVNIRYGGRRGKLAHSTIAKISNANRGNKTCVGRKLSVETRKKIASSLGYNGIWCSNGETYLSTIEAAKATNTWRQNIRHVLNGRQKTTGGLYFKRMGQE